ncbi:MAG: isoleucine--tRNA ligase [Candidatus Omnitrophica bacterium]|nr:isoleucine--tRNA ligase [Candidatus Omnitrophota bacterium]
MDYKSTLNLPKTDFAMKADLPKREPLFLDRWREEGLYARILEKAKGRPKYVLHDGPPYSNGDIHIGHALNKILKDIIIKFKTMCGFHCCYVPGWDCHGLPVEHQLFKELGITKAQIDQLEFRKKAHAYAMRYVGIQREQFRRLGVFADWENPYLTLDKGYEADIVRSLGKLAKGGYIYKGLKPVNWCPACETALAEAEVEYEEHVSPSVYVKFKLESNPIFSKDMYLAVWTTTPWTLMANVAVAVHPDLSYAHIKTASGDLIIAEVRLQALSQIGIADYKIVGTFKGKDLEGLVYDHPFGLRKGKIVLADYVSREDGTGLVHTAPGHGQEDYLTGLRYKLPVIMPVDSKGNFDATCGELSGINVHKANALIIDKLRKLGALIFTSDISHSYPHCWRCKNPVIFRATPQWFMGVDHDGLRGRLLEAITKGVKWVPPTGRERIFSMVQNRPDWCLSRQRLWGVPIAAFYCSSCGAELLRADVMEHVAGLVAKEGADVWFAKKEEELLPPGVVCAKCGGSSFRKETDIIDVWFDSGISHQAVLKRRGDLGYPCDLYLEGSDQHRGWFQSALITAMAIDNISPFKAVLTHGFVVDGEGKKMSKSLGNVVSPQDVIKDYGADILRLWVASSDYSEDVRISGEILVRLADAYRKIRNTYKFILGNLFDFDPAKDSVDLRDMLEIDRWALSETSKLVDMATRAYESFSFHDAFRSVYDFCVIQLSSFYLDILKDRLYISGTKSIERRSGQTALFEILKVIIKTMAPICAFTSDEAWLNLHKGLNGSVHLAQWPDQAKGALAAARDTGLEGKWALIISAREEVLKALESKREAGLIGSSLEARVRLYSKDEALGGLLLEYRRLLPSIFIVSAVEVMDAEFEDRAASGTSGLMIGIDKAPGLKCQRCWNWSESVGKNDSHPSLCGRCVNIVKGETG